MGLQTLLNLIGTVFYVAMCLIGTASVIAHARVLWRQSRMGVHLMIYMGSFALTLDLGLVKLIIGDSLGFQMLRLVAFALLPFAMGQRLWLQLQAQRKLKGSGTDKESAPEPLRPSDPTQT